MQLYAIKSQSRKDATVARVTNLRYNKLLHLSFIAYNIRIY